ncbi:uncharacterized protein BJ212DRAFT_1381790 [Suillus subaureus]|uniref:Uncharacterized protein n=1 Tax=Suillus subaureus TaxID=48587 RepID=A0A9P7E1V9_9AGAM|nr:uncharacterized protein BJ212DRAFT_1381790 [Suillus subaureus]KAG1808982.1 hypothetical protein BJ212DRAFT_1381790 [Suillus subaureus]
MRVARAQLRNEGHSLATDMTMESRIYHDPRSQTVLRCKCKPQLRKTCRFNNSLLMPSNDLTLVILKLPAALGYRKFCKVLVAGMKHVDDIATLLRLLVLCPQSLQSSYSINVSTRKLRGENGTTDNHVFNVHIMYTLSLLHTRNFPACACPMPVTIGSVATLSQEGSISRVFEAHTVVRYRFEISISHSGYTMAPHAVHSSWRIACYG